MNLLNVAEICKACNIILLLNALLLLGMLSFKSNVLHLVSNVQLVNVLYCEMTANTILPYSLTGNAWCTLLLRTHPSIISIHCRSCLIGCLVFISREWFLMARRADRHGSKPLPQASPNVVIVFIKLVRANSAQVFKASTISNVRRNQTIFCELFPAKVCFYPYMLC